ncbi:hypothetical protein [Streptomyces sp. NPDC000851]
MRACFSVGHPVTELVRRAIRALLEQVRHPALEQGGSLRHGAQVAELTGMVGLDGYPDGTRTTVRHERPHPGAQLSLLDLDEGMCHEVFLTDTLLSRRRCPRERLAEALNGTFKAELIEMQGPCCCAGKAIFFAECHIFRDHSV